MKISFEGARPALFLDLDSTVRYCVDPKMPCPNMPNDISIYPGVVDKINNFKKADFYVFGVSNQGGIEMGYITEERCAELMEVTNTKMGGVFDKIIWASKLRSQDRKPNPGMIKKLQKEFNIDLETSIMVGDKDSDLMCSLNAGVKQFFYAKDFFVEGHKQVESQRTNNTYIDQMR